MVFVSVSPQFVELIWGFQVPFSSDVSSVPYIQSLGVLWFVSSVRDTLSVRASVSLEDKEEFVSFLKAINAT